MTNYGTDDGTVLEHWFVKEQLADWMIGWMTSQSKTIGQSVHNGIGVISAKLNNNNNNNTFI